MKNKRFLAVILVILTSHTMMNGTVMGMAEPAYVPEIKYFNDFAADKTYFAGATGYTSLEDSGEEMSGQALAINPVKDLSYINVNTPMKDGKDFSMSFDFKAQQEDHPLSMFTQESGNVRIAAINYDVKGNLVINSKAGSFPNASGNYSSNTNLISTYVGTDWTNITMHFHPDGYNTTIDWYIDGKFIVTSVASNVTSGKNFSGGMDTFHFGTTQSGEGISDASVIYDGDEQFLIDNFKIEYIDSEYAYSTLKTQVGMETNELEIVFSEPLDTEITSENISVTNTETGELVNVTEVKGSANKTGRMNIVVDGGFIADTEYSINLPENVKGVSGRKMFSDKIYFVPVGVLDVECPTITESILKTNGDCEDLPEGTLESLGKEKGNWTKYLVCDWVYDISAENTGTDEDRNMAICFAPDHTSTQFLRVETEGNENSPFIPDTGKDSIVWSMDVMRKELVRTYPLTFIMGKDNVGAAGVGMFFFDSYGNFVFLNGSGDWWSTDDKDIANGEEYSSKQTAYQAEIEAGECVNVTAVINSKSETVTYFVDNKYAGTADWPSNRKGKGYNYFSGMRINPEETYRDGRVMYFDNYKLGYAEIESNKKVTSVRMFDRFGNSYAPMEQNVITDIRSINVSFNNQVGDISEAEITLHDDNGNEVEISNIRTEQKKIIADVDEILEKNTLYYITVSGVKTNDGNEEFKAYESSFNTTPEGEFTVTNFELRDLSGNPISDISEVSEGESIILNVSAINTTDEDVYLNASLTAYNNSVIADDEVMEIEFGANTRNTDADIEIEVPDTENLYVIATLTDEMKKTVTDAIELGTAVTSVDSWTLVFEGETTPNSKIYAEIQAPEDSVEGFVYRGQLISDEAGKFKVLARVFDNPEIENDAKSGEYVLSWVDENGNKGTKSIGFANVNEKKKIADDIVGFVTNQDKETAIKSIAQILSSENSRYALNITDDIQKDELPVTAEIIYNYVKDGKTEDTSLTINVNKAVCISGVVSGRIENLFDYSEKLELDSSKIAEFYKGSYVTEEVEKSVTAKICGKKITDSQDFYDILEEAFVLAVVENPDGEDNLKKIMNAFHEEIGIVKNGKDKAYREVMYNSYKSYAELKKAFNNANTSSQSGGGSSSGGSGGGYDKPKTSVIGTTAGSNTEVVQIPYSVFSDIENVAWAKDAIVRLAEMQIINGKGENKFYPNDNITRAEFAKIVVLAFEYKNTSGAESGFSDVPGWAKEYVDNAFANEIVNGYSNEIFGSGDKITRQDLVTMAYRAAVKAGEEYDAQSSNIFSDSAFISDYAKDAVHTLFNAGMINGVGNGEFAPTAFATRAEAAKIIYNMIMN